jgi:hypothetical protein
MHIARKYAFFSSSFILKKNIEARISGQENGWQPEFRHGKKHRKYAALHQTLALWPWIANDYICVKTTKRVSYGGSAALSGELHNLTAHKSSDEQHWSITELKLLTPWAPACWVFRGCTLLQQV